MQPKTQGLCRWRARNSSRIILNLSSTTMRCDAADTVEYSEGRVCVEQYTFTHDSFLPTIISWWAATAPGPYDGRPREDTF
jgi:hypothetical protein